MPNRAARRSRVSPSCSAVSPTPAGEGGGGDLNGVAGAEAEEDVVEKDVGVGDAGVGPPELEMEEEVRGGKKGWEEGEKEKEKEKEERKPASSFRCATHGRRPRDSDLV
eukprot:754469-Hanusia_phi.AAC.1